MLKEKLTIYCNYYVPGPGTIVKHATRMWKTRIKSRSASAKIVSINREIQEFVNINVPFLLKFCSCIVRSCHSEYIKNFKNISGSFSHRGHDGPLCIKKSANRSTHHHRWKACSTKWRYNTYSLFCLNCLNNSLRLLRFMAWYLMFVCFVTIVFRLKFLSELLPPLVPQ